MSLLQNNYLLLVNPAKDGLQENGNTDIGTQVKRAVIDMCQETDRVEREVKWTKCGFLFRKPPVEFLCIKEANREEGY